MNWRHMLFLSCLTAFLLLIVLDDKCNSVKAITESSSEENSLVPLVPDLKKNFFLQKLDASKFLKKQGKRSARSSEEPDAHCGSDPFLVPAKERRRLETKESQEYESDNTTEEDSEENDDRTESDEYYD